MMRYRSEPTLKYRFLLFRRQRIAALFSPRQPASANATLIAMILFIGRADDAFISLSRTTRLSHCLPPYDLAKPGLYWRRCAYFGFTPPSYALKFLMRHFSLKSFSAMPY